ncbi:MAG: M1 family metallopeptidase [Candidatus Eisenbacteria bacterium]|nr:M1 family metallopeptidase [Candidatus Eisenbacteria bacterium]
MRTSFVLAIVLVIAAAAGAGPRHVSGDLRSQPVPARDRTPALDIVHYRLDLEMLPDTRELQGTATITMQSVGEILATIPLDLVALVVQGVTEGTDSVSFTADENGVVLLPDLPLHPGEPRTFAVRYGGCPVPESGGSPWGGFFFTGSTAYSVGVGLYADPPSMGRHWFPGHDVPSDKATSDITLRVPSGWIGIANGSLLSDSFEGDTRVMRWGTELPIATYLMAVAGGPYVELADSAGSVPIRHYVLPSQVDRARASFIHVPQMIDLYSRLFGPYPFERFGYVSSSLSGGMEHQTMVTLGSFAIDGFLTWESLVAHELAHQWWGDCVTYQDWTQIWLSEGFATYCEALWAEENDGQEGYVASVLAMMQEYLGSGEDYFPLNEPDVLWGSATYEKGACVVHMLRQVLGDSLFYAGLVRFRAQHEYGNATVDGLQASLEEATSLDMAWFFDQWVREPGHPELAFRYATYPYGNGDTGVDLEIRQLQDIGPVFRFPFEVAFQLADSTVRQSFVDSLPAQAGSFRVPGPVSGVAMDPDHDLLFRNLGTSTSDRLELAHVTIGDDVDMDGGLDPGENADVVVGILNSFGSLGATTLELVCDDPGITIIDGFARLDSIPAGSIVTNGGEPFRIQSAPGSARHQVSASIRATTEADAVITVPLPLYLGTATRLLVDDAGVGNSYAPYFLSAMDTLPDGEDRELWVTHRQGSPMPARLAKYADRGMVTWFTGDADSMALGDEDVAGLEALLAAGGALFLTGQNAVDDLGASPAGQAFRNGCLKIDVVDADYAATRAVMGEEDDPVGNGIAGVIQGNGGANNQTSLTVIEPMADAFPVMYYRNSDMYCAARTAGPGRVVVFSFGFEALNETQPQFVSREEMMRRVADWLEGPGTRTPELPSPSMMVWAPAPWRGTACLRVDLPEPALVRAELYDLLGRRTHVLFAGSLPSGTSRIGLPAGITSGTYLLIARAGPAVARSPVIVVP